MATVYRAMFEDFRKDGLAIDRPCIVESLDDARDAIAGDRPFHLVILDLRLPERVGGPSEELSARGLQLITPLGERALFPVPALLILTGDPRRITSYPALRRQLAEQFWWAEISTKGLEIDADVRGAIEVAARFDMIGVHVVDLLDDVKPQLTPREEHLLRQAVMRVPNAIGVDLRWWSAGRRDFGKEGMPGWVKVLYGRIVFDQEHGASRLRFFKFGSRENGLNAVSSARAIGERLQHIRVIDFQSDRERSLLITDNVGVSDNRPLALAEVLTLGLVEEDIAALANDIGDQVRTLGEITRTQIPIPQLLWPYHDGDRLSQAWRSVCSDTETRRFSPTGILHQMRIANGYVATALRLTHGDLHVENVAVDRGVGRFRAFIFDAGPLKRDVAVRDLAMLEISVALHIARSQDSDIIEAASSLFDGRARSGAIDFAEVPAVVAGDVRLLSYLRREAMSESSSTVYLLLLIDALLMQMGGLAFGFTSNKISKPADAVRLFDLLVKWMGAHDVAAELRIFAVE